MAIYVYLAVLIILGILFLASAKENPVSDQPVSAAMRPFRKAAVWIYRKYRRLNRNKRRRGGAVPSSEMVRMDLSILNPYGKTGRAAAFYYIRKIQNLLLFLTIADLLAMAVWYSSRQNSSISTSGSIRRPGYGEEDLEIETVVTAENQTNEKNEVPIDLQISAREYTREQTDEMAAEVYAGLPRQILGDNQSLSHVTQDLNLITGKEGMPFRIRWVSSRYGLVDSDGSVYSDMLAEGTSAAVKLTAVLTYLDRRYEQSFEVTVFPKEKAAVEKLKDDIAKATVESNEATASDTVFYLPSKVDGVSLSWREKAEDNSPILFAFISVAGVIVFFMSDRDLHRRIEIRERQMALDYPKVVSKMVLLLGAGMSVRNAFTRMGKDYLMARKRGGDERYVYEEILFMCREWDSGISETAVLSHFGKRCRSLQYTKFCSLLEQSQTKGNSALLQTLQEEADLAFAERKNLARRMGEEAGTKLLLPMVLMLAVTLVIIMIPAYFSFSL